MVGFGMQHGPSAWIPVFVLALSGAGFGQEDPPSIGLDPTKKDTVRMTVSGGVVLDHVTRSQGMTHFIGAGLGDPANTSPGAGSDSETTFEGFMFARMDFALSTNVTGVIEFGTKGVDGGATTLYGVSGATSIVLREAHANLSEFLHEDVSAQVGMTTWSFDVRGKGSSFAFDPRHSSSFAKNLSPYADTAAKLGSNLKDELDTMGVVGTWENELIRFDLVLLPTVVEGGAPSQDEALYAADLFYALDGQGSRIGGIVAVVAVGNPAIVSPELALFGGAGSGHETMIVTIGGGATLKLIDSLELYGEGYFQSGHAGEVDVDGPLGPIAPADLEAGGTALQAGLQITFGGMMNPWIDGSITMITGDDDPPATTITGDGSVDKFMSYEAVNDLMILEDATWGFDWDSNYHALKVKAGIMLTPRLELSGIFGSAHAMEYVEFLGPAGTSRASFLGNEVDARIRWSLNKQVSLTAAVAFLMDSDVLEGSMESPGAGAIVNPFANGADSQDSASLYVAGFDLSF